MLWLYDEFETDFTYNGIVLNNAYDSDIHWVLNTMYKLTFKYPTVDNDLYSFIEKGMIVKADEHDRTNLFRIKDIDISENDKCITVTAYQKNYDFSKRLVNNFGRLRVNCMSVLDEWYSNFLSSEKDFSYYSDINAINSFVSHNDDTDNKLRTSFELLGGIADTYSADIDMHDKQISLLERLGRDTEEVLTTAKNISEFVNTSNSDEIVTRIYASSTFKVGDKYDKKDLREQHRQQLKALRESQKEYSQGRNAVKKAQQMKDEIAKKYAKELAKNNKKVKRSGKVIKTYSQIESEVNAKYQERERKSQQRKAESQAIADRKKAEIESLKAQQKEELDALDEEVTINLIVESPLINDYPFINEIAVSNNDLRTAEELEEWAMEYFTKQNIDKPKNSIKVTYEQLSEDINRGDTVILKYLKYGVDERIRVVETHYDPMLKKWKEFILGEKEGRLGSEVSSASSGAIAKANAYTDIITMDIERKVKERNENYDKLFKKNTDEINKKIEDGFEKAKASSEVTIAKIDEDLEKKLAPIRNQVSTTVENYNRQFQATNLEISKNRVEATKQIQALSERVGNIQDISNNETVRELRGLVNGATSKVTELETSITREFTAVKKKNEDSLNAVKAEFTKGVDGLTSKVSSLEEYKNQDGTRTENLKQWVQRDTASQLNRERTEINKIIDNKGFVKNTEFSSKFTESARGINNQLSALETYKNQDGVRVANMQIWAQNNTANQLTAARRSIESWVNEKGYATTSVVENKVRETANSFSREISNVRNSIPTSVGGRNRALKTTKDWGEFVNGESGVGSNLRIPLHVVLADGLKAGDKLLISMEYSIDDVVRFGNSNITAKFQGLGDVTEWSATGVPFFQNIGELSTGDNYRVAKFEVVLNSEMIKNNSWNLEIRVDGARSCKAHTKKCKIEVGNIYTDWTPAPEDDQQSINELNTWKQTANQTLNTVTSTLNDTVRHSQLRVGADKIDFGSNQVFDGRNLASMLSVSPESINAITDKLVITPSNENLVRVNQRESITSSERDTFITDDIKEDLSDGAEFYFKAKFSSNGRGKQRIGIHIYVTYTDNSQSWGFTEMFPINSYAWSEERTATLKFGKTAGKKVKHYAFGIHQSAWNDFSSWTIKGLELYKKKSAELIVDGSIEGRQIKAKTLETGHHKAGSITSEIIAAKAVKVNNLLVDDAMIDAFVAHKAFITKLWAKDAFIKSLQTVKIKSTQIDTDTLTGVTIRGNSKIQLGEHGFLQPINNGLQINAPKSLNATSGVGFQIHGYKQWFSNGTAIPKGVFIYSDDDFNTGGVISSKNETLLTVAGTIIGRSYTDANGKYREGAMVVTPTSSSPGQYSIMNIYSGDGYFVYNTAGTIVYVKIAQTSDVRLKKNIRNSKISALNCIEKMNFKEFNWIKDNKFEEIGLIAQDLKEINENFVSEKEDGLLLLNEDSLRMYTLKAIQELSQQNKELKNKLEELING